MARVWGLGISRVQCCGDRSIWVLIHASLQSSVASVLHRLRIRLNLIEDECSEILCSSPLLSSPLFIVINADIHSNMQPSNCFYHAGMSLNTTAHSLWISSICSNVFKAKQSSPSHCVKRNRGASLGFLTAPLLSCPSLLGETEIRRNISPTNCTQEQSWDPVRASSHSRKTHKSEDGQ